jgi:integrase
MAIRKRGKKYQIDYYDPAGKRVRPTFATRKVAKDELGKRTTLIAEGRYLDVKKENTTTLEEVLAEYEKLLSYQTFFKTGKVFTLKRIREYFGPDRLIGTITYKELESFRAKLMETPATVKMRDGREKIKGKRKNTTINKQMSCLRHVFKKAKSWGMIDHNPFNDGESFLLKENNMYLRYFTPEEAERLLDACGVHLRPIVLFCLYTGARHGEAVGLRWYQIAGGHVNFVKTKTEDGRLVPLNEAVLAMLDSIRPMKAGGKVVDLDGNKISAEDAGGHVFTYQGKPIADVDIAFKGACSRAGIPFGRKIPGGVTFYTLRHTFASWLAIAGVPIKTIQELMGHKHIQMTMRYAHLSEKVKKDAVKLLPPVGRDSDSHKMVTKRKNED